MTPPDWDYLERVQREISLPDAAWPEFAGVLVRAKREVEAEYLPKPLGPLPEDPLTAVRLILNAVWERINLTTRARMEAPYLAPPAFAIGDLLLMLQLEAGLLQAMPTEVETEIRDVLAALDQLRPLQAA